MAFNRLPAKDPRTVARDIPGVFDALFPQLVAGVVAHFNRHSRSFDQVTPLPEEFVKSSKLSRSMLFEIAYVRGEQLLEGIAECDWPSCIDKAVQRQRRHFDAAIPEEISDSDKAAAEWVGGNLFSMLSLLKNEHASALRFSPMVPGYEWIASGQGDFSIGDTLIEVKCTARHFSSSDYRQLIMYWLLGYAASIENKAPEWQHGILMNPRRNLLVEFSFKEMLSVVAAGRSKVEILELFAATVGEYASRMLAEEP